MMTTRIQAQLKAYLLDNRLTQQQLAEKLGISTALVEGWLAKKGTKRYRTVRKPYLKLLGLE